MSDRTMIALGRNTLSVPRIAKKALQIATATGLTALVTLGIVMANSLLMGRTGYLRGIEVWLSFIQRPDIAGTIVLTATVTVAFLYSSSRSDKR